MNLSMYQGLDDEILAALSNKGLLRRAQKDLKATKPELQEERADALLYTMPGENCTVTLPATGPTKAGCTCPADGVCRHILTAALFLRAQAQQAPAEPAEVAPAPIEAMSQPDPLLDLSEHDLIAWADRKLYRQAVDELAFGEMEIVAETEGKTTRFRFPQHNLVVRWVTGSRLDSLICSCKQRPACKHAVAVILFYQALHGKPLPTPEKKVLGAKAGTPRTREEVLESVQKTLAEMIALGLGRLSKTTEGRFITLAISAHGVDLPALESSLRSLSDHLSWHLNRDVRANTTVLLSAAARSYALAFALANAQGVPPAALVGEHKKRYHEIANLELVGVGAQQWRSRAGYIGLTLYFWDVTGQRWTSWADARPTIHGDIGFNPQHRYKNDEMWDSAPAPGIISRSRFRLSNPKRNRQGQLSGRKQCQALISGPADLTTLNLEGVEFDDWSKLAEHIAASHASGLVKGSPLDALVVIKPATWGEPVYDQMRQVLVRPVFDAAGRSLPLILSYAADWPFAVDTLQSWNPQQWDTWGILGRAIITSEGLQLTPTSLLNRAKLPRPIQSSVLHLTLDTWKAATTLAPETTAPAAPEIPTSKAASPDDGDEEEEDVLEEDQEDEQEDDFAGANSAIGQLLRIAGDELEQIAERGARASSPAVEERLRSLAGRLRQIGLLSCANAMMGVSAQLATGRHQITPETEHIARALLHGYYTLRLAMEQLAVAETLAKYQSVSS